MFRLINQKSAIQWIILILLWGLAEYRIICDSSLIAPDGFPLLYNYLYSFTTQNKIVYAIVLSITLILTIVGLQLYFSKNKFSNKITYLPSIFYLFFLHISGALGLISPLFFSNLLVVCILLINDLYKKSQKIHHLLFAGIIIGLAVLIDPAMIVLFLFIIISLIINTVISYQQIMSTLLGIIIVAIYVVSIYFFTDRIPEIVTSFKEIELFALFNKPLLLSYQKWIKLGIIVLLTIYIFMKSMLIAGNKIVEFRKKIFTLITLLIVLFSSIAITGLDPALFSRHLIIPFALLFALAAQYRKNWIVNEIFFVIFCVGLWL